MICIKSIYIMYTCLLYMCIIYITRAILCVMTHNQSAWFSCWQFLPAEGFPNKEKNGLGIFRSRFKKREREECGMGALEGYTRGGRGGTERMVTWDTKDIQRTHMEHTDTRDTGSTWQDMRTDRTNRTHGTRTQTDLLLAIWPCGHLPFVIWYCPSGIRHLAFAMWHWQSGNGHMAFAIWHWLLALAIWHWPYGIGLLATAICNCPSGIGHWALANWNWLFGIVHLGLAM